MKKAGFTETALIVGGPLTLAVLELFHPHPHDLFNLDVSTWLAVHYAQIPLFPLAGLALTLLVRGKDGIASTICRVAAFVFAVSFTAFDTAAGVVTGILLKAAFNSGSPETWRGPIDAVWTHPIMGGLPLGRPPLLALLGSIALSVSAMAAAVALKLEGRSWAPVVLLAASSFGISVFKSHAWPGGPLTFGGLAIAGAWLQWERARQNRSVS